MLYQHEATIEVRGRFPVDMLRFDCCYPKSGEDVNAIARSLGRYPDEPYRVTVCALSRRKNYWTPDRWQSFNARVTATERHKA